LNRSHIEIGFLLLYDWLPALKKLPLADAARLMFAMIDRQRNGIPFPTFKNDLANTFADMIEPSIERRLVGSASGKRGAAMKKAAEVSFTAPHVPPATESATPPVTGPVHLKQSKAEQSKAEHSIGEGGAREAPPTAAREEPAACAAPVGGEAPTPTLCEVAEGELDFLEANGVPRSYVMARYARAVEWIGRHGGNMLQLLHSWWRQDLVEGNAEVYLRTSSLDIDDFVDAALAKTYGEG
jgi:hypothetical protein